MNFPSWMTWEIEVTPHIEKRMLFNVKSIKNDIIKGRYVIETRHLNHKWEVIVEPDIQEELLVVITAYKSEA